MLALNRRLLYIPLIVFLLFLLLQGCTNSNNASKESTDPKTIVEKFTNALYNNNIKDAMAFVSDDIIIEQTPPGTKFEGKDKYETALQNSSIWNHKEKVTSPFTVDGNKVSFTTEQEGDDFQILGISRFRITRECIVRDGKISEIRSYPNESDWQVIIKNNAGGIGIKISSSDKGQKIDQVLKNSPAEKSGLKPNDVIVAINDTDSTKMSPEMATLRIKGPIGSKVKLLIYRYDNPALLDFDIERVDASTIKKE